MGVNRTLADAARPLPGLMQLQPLSLHRILEHASRWHGDRDVVSRRLDGAILRSDWATVRNQARAASAEEWESLKGRALSAVDELKDAYRSAREAAQ